MSRPEVSVDVELRALARHEARWRLSLGRLAAAFRKIDGHHRLGFARIGDYSRERLGLSGREVHSLASVASRLADLPAIALAFSSGELSWSQVRILTAVATPESETEWLIHARGRAVRALIADVRRETAGGAGESETLRSTLDEESGAIEGEETVLFRMRCPGRVLSLWRRTVELARRMSGAQIAPWRAAEAIAAEGMSAAPEAGDTGQPGETGDLQENALSTPAPLAEPDILAEAFPRFDWGLHDETDEYDDLDDSDGDAGSLDAFALDSRMRSVVRSMQSIDSRTGKLLRRLLDFRLYRALGFSSVDHYVRERLGMSPSRARALVVIERRSDKAPALSTAYARGELSWVRALSILPVVCGEHEKDWLVRAGSITVRRLADEVEWALGERDARGIGAVAPPDPSLDLNRHDLQTCARREGEKADREVTFFAPLSVVNLFREAVAGFTPPGESGWQGLERLLLHAEAEWSSQPRHRDPIFERDGWRCAVPACSSRRNLHDHHYRFRSRGGTNERDNRGATCAWHHLRGIHGGLVRGSGRAPDDILWELGLRSGHAALLILHGDRYVSPVFDN